MPTPEPAAAAAREQLTPTNAAKRWHAPSIVLLLAGLALGSAGLVVYTLSDDQSKKPVEPPKGSAWSYDGVFPNWPKDRKPDFVIVITGQTYGYLQKCGCSDPQKGGLERRFNFIAGFKTHGIEVIPLDIGDVAPHLHGDYTIQRDQALLKYKTAMNAMKAMGYRAVGIGQEEFNWQLDAVLGEYSLQKGNETPKVLAANLLNKKDFPSEKVGESLVHDFEMIPTRSRLNVGVVGIVGDPVLNQVKKNDKNIAFAGNSAEVLTDTLKAMMQQPAKPNLAVLLYNGPVDLAQKAARAFPQFRIVACLTEQAEPPNDAQLLTDPKDPRLNTLLVQVGHKGQNVGVVGVFKDNKGSFELKYQRVAMNPEFESPEGKEKDNPAIQELERYSQMVRARDFLSKHRKTTHALQVSNPKAAFVGSQACMNCHKEHDNSWQVYAASKHSHAYAALQNIAKKPSLRNFDPECIRCHTVGYDFNTGFVDTVKTQQLINVGCESCHGPGSQHVSDPMNRKLALELSPWKTNGEGQLPSVEKLKAYYEEKDPVKQQKILNPAEYQTMLRADRTCQTCHNQDNDPHFKFELFWPKVVHSRKPNPAKVGPAKRDDDGPKLAPPTGPELNPPKN